MHSFSEGVCSSVQQQGRSSFSVGGALVSGTTSTTSTTTASPRLPCPDEHQHHGDITAGTEARTGVVLQRAVICFIHRMPKLQETVDPQAPGRPTRTREKEAGAKFLGDFCGPDGERVPGDGSAR